MKYIKFFIFSIVSFILFTLTSYAECSTDELISLQRAASLIKTGYTYKDVENPTMLNDKSVEFTLSIYNLSDEVYIDVYGIFGIPKKTFTSQDTSNGTINITNLSALTQNEYNIYIRSNNPNCHGRLMINKKIITPKYNEYSASYECKEYPDFKLCQKFNNSNIDYDDFLNQLDDYINDLEEEKNNDNKNENKKEEKKSFVNLIKDIYKENKKTIFLVISIIIIVILIILISIVIRKRRIVR